MPLSDMVTVTISTMAKGVSRAGFGTPLIAAYHSLYNARVKAYTSLASMVTDGFTAADPAYKAAAVILGQTPHPASIKVGRRALPMTQKVKLAPVSNTVGVTYACVVVDPSGNSTDIEYEVEAGKTIADICAKLKTQLDTVSDLTTTNNSTYVQSTAVAGSLFAYNELNADLELTDVTADPGIATDLAAIQLYDSDWYALCIDSNSEAEIKAAQAYLETLEKIGAYNTADAGARQSVITNDILSDLKALAYVRCVAIYSGDFDGYAGAAWLGRMLPQNPGRATWAYKTLTGVAVDTLNINETAAIKAKNGNYYVATAGLNLTEDGRTPDGIFIDITTGRDWLTARLRERVVSLLANALKIPYTDDGVAMMYLQVDAQLKEGQSPAYGYLATDPAYVITVPKVADVSASDRANRLLPDVNFSATLQGAIHKVEITGVVSV